MKQPSGGTILCSALEGLGVAHIFGLPGTQNVSLFEALRQSSIRTILATHELAAGFMANGYFRASGKVGVLTTIPGPGFAFTVAAIAEAAQDSVAMLYIVGRPARRPERKFNLQAIDQRAILSTLVKRIVEVDCAADISGAVREAYATTTSGEPGPVMLHIDDQVIASYLTSLIVGGNQEGRTGKAPATQAADPEQVAHAVRLLLDSKRAVLFVGQGSNDAADQVRRLAELLQAPVVTTRSARGIVPEDHPLAKTFDFTEQAVGALNVLLDRSDLILAIGCKFTHNGTYGFKLHFPKEKLIHIDASVEVLNANYPARLSICADASEFLHALLRSSEDFQLRSSGWSEEEQNGPKRSGAQHANNPEPAVQGVVPATPEGFFAALRKAMPAHSCLVTDSGLHQVLATRYFRVQEPRGMVIPSDFQSMGFGLPGAIGAKLAAPDRAVVVLMGDGGLAMSGIELITAVRERIPITVIVFNDGALGQIRMQQLSSFGHSHATELFTPDLALLAESVGANYLHLDGDAANTLTKVINANVVTLVEVTVGDSLAMRVMQAKGLARHTARRVVKASTLNWIKSKLSR